VRAASAPPNSVAFSVSTTLSEHVSEIDCVEGKPVSYNPRDMKPEPSKQYGRSLECHTMERHTRERHMDSIGSSSSGYPRYPLYCSFIAGKSI
jgi:hypothetical protein